MSPAPEKDKALNVYKGRVLSDTIKVMNNFLGYEGLHLHRKINKHSLTFDSFRLRPFSFQLSRCHSSKLVSWRRIYERTICVVVAWNRIGNTMDSKTPAALLLAPLSDDFVVSG